VQDVIVIGGGIVGLAVARAVLGSGPDRTVTVVEKERVVAAHQTGHNSGVLHSGIYYRPGSLKARTTFAGRKAMLEFCENHDLPLDVCGKVVVATREDELGRLAVLEERGQANGVPLTRITPGELREIEPNAAGIAALHVPGVAVLDFGEVCRALAADLTAAGADVRTGVAVSAVEELDGTARVTTTAGELEARVVVNCAGLQSDRVARLHDPALTDVRIIPFRGEYYELVPDRRDLVRALIYPVPDPNLPFLGVHFTKMIDGSVHAGPNAVLALAREGYRWRDVRWRDVDELLRFRGTWRVARTHWRIEIGEVVRSLSRRAFLRGLQRLVPAVEGHDLVRAEAGVRAQAVDRTGALLDDFVLRESPRVVDVVNAPSPAATASLEIGRVVGDLVDARLRA
jgi:L-2-hydroxyglutarate oxidase